jgi:hypothetical protein
LKRSSILTIVLACAATWFAAGLLATPAAAQSVEYLPVCTLPNCLSPRVISKAGVGTANAVAEAKVTLEDATRWCSKYKPNYRICPQDEVERGGTGGGARLKKNYTATANCQTGELRPIDGRSYKYVGTWPDGPGRGRPRFQGSLSEIGGRQFQQDTAGLANGATSIYELAVAANSGESLAVQWEMLCKGAQPPMMAAAAPAPSAMPPAPAAMAAAQAPVQSGRNAAPVMAAQAAGRPNTAAPRTRPGAPAVAPPIPSICAMGTNCTETATFAATIMDFRPSVSGRYRLATATVRFQNKTSQPLILGYVRESGLLLDNKGNRYAVNDATVRGMGVISGTSFDPKFTLRAGEAADARFEFGWESDGRTVFGTVYDPLELTLREIDVAGMNQYRLGREHALSFRNPGQSGEMTSMNQAPAGAATGSGPVMTRAGGAAPAVGSQARSMGAGAPASAGGMTGDENGMAAAAAGVAGGASATSSVAGAAGANSTAAGASKVAGTANSLRSLFGRKKPAQEAAAVPLESPSTAAAAVPSDPCGGDRRCYNAGPFTATVNQVTAVQQANARVNRTVRFNVTIRNISGQPIILAYLPRTSTAVDSQGNPFFDTGATGIGVSDGRSVNTQFTLGPGQSRGAAFGLFRRPDRTVIGTSWTWDVTLAEVQVLGNGQQVQTVREHSLHFPDLTADAGSGAGAANLAPPADAGDSIKKLGDIFHKK